MNFFAVRADVAGLEVRDAAVEASVLGDHQVVLVDVISEEKKLLIFHCK